MKHLLALASAVMILGLNASAQLHITSNTTWSTDQILTQSVIVDPGATLTINPGVHVRPIYTDQNGDNVGDIFIEVNGTLNINGEVCNRVVFEPFETTTNRNYWQGVFIDAGTNNDQLQHFNVTYAAQGLQLIGDAEINGAFVFECQKGITVNASSIATVDNSWVHTNTGSGINNQGGTLTLNNTHVTNNGKFGLTNHAGTLVVGFCTIDQNAWGGVFIGGAGANDIQNSSILNNQGSGFEISEWTSANDFTTPASNSGIPTVLVNTCNIHGNAPTSYDMVLDADEAFLNIPDWGACQALIQANVGQSATWELPIGYIASQTVTCVRYCAGTQSSWNRTYRLRNDYLSEDVGVTTQSTYDPCNCGFVVNLGNRYHAGPRTFTGSYAPTDRYHWYIGANSTSSHAIWDAVTTIRLGGYEVYSSVGNATSFNFTNNYWGTFLNVDALVYDVNNANTNYAGFATAGFGFAVANVDDGLPNIALGNDTNICEGTPLVLDAGNPGSSFLWSPGGFTTQTLAVSTAGTYTVAVTNDCGTETAEITVLGVDPLPLAPATPVGQTLLCPNSPNTNYTVNAAQFATSYEWHVSPANAGTVSGTGTTGVVDWAPDFIGQASVWAKAVNDCGESSNSPTLVVNVINAPSTPASPVGEAAFCTAPEVSTYTTQGLPLADTYTWSLSPANAGTITGTGTSADVVWNSSFEGIASISVSGNGYCGQGNTSQPLLVSLGLYEATITGSTSVCTGETTVLTANAADDYLWSTGETTQSIEVMVDQLTNVALTIFDDAGCEAQTSINLIPIQLPDVSVFATNEICLGETALLTISGADNYAWSNGMTGNMIEVSPTESTVYTVIATNFDGCSTEVEVGVQVYDVPNVTIAAPSSVCAGSSIVLTASGADEYFWQGGPTASTWEVTPTTNTTYTVAGFSEIGCEAQASVSVIVNPSPTATITGDNFLCAGESVVLTAGGGNVIGWSNGATGSSTEVSPSTTTTYTVTVSNGQGCTDEASFEVVVSNFAGGNISGPEAVCEGASITLVASGASSYAWNTGTTGAVLNTTPTETTEYSVAMTSAQGCTADVFWLVTVHPLPPTPTIVLFGNELLSSSATGNQWYYSGVPLPNQTNQNLIPIQNGDYTVQVTDANGCSSTSAPYSYTGVGVVEQAKDQLNWYPNPFDNHLTIENRSGAAVERIRIFNAQGALVHDQNAFGLSQSALVIETQHLSAGVYHIAVTTGDGVFTFTTVKSVGAR